MVLSHSVRGLITLKSIIKEVIYNLGIDSKNIKLVYRFTFYEYDNRAIVIEKIPRMTPTSNQISVKYHWFRQSCGKKFLIRKTESEN